MKALVYIYNEYVHFEIEVLATLLSSAGQVETVALDDQLRRSRSSFSVKSDKVINDINVGDYDLLIIPGGDPNSEELQAPALLDLISKFNDQGKTIGAICAAPIALARAQALDGKQYTTTLEPTEFEEFNEFNFLEKDVLVSENVITAMGMAYVEFAIEVFQKVVGFESKEERASTLNFFKNNL